MKENLQKSLTAKEKQFCLSYINCGNIKEAAISAGYSKTPQQDGEKLLGRSYIANEVSRLFDIKRKSLATMAMVGYERLAFGNVADAVELLYIDNPTLEKLKEMDLFSVSEIRRPKEGAMEIKFFDRLKALEKLAENSCDSSGAVPFYEALKMGAQAVCKERNNTNNEL